AGPGQPYTFAQGIGLAISGDDLKGLDAQTLNLAGTTVWTGSGNLSMSNGATINNSGAFTIQNDKTIMSDGRLDQTFNKTGALTKAAGPSITAINAPFSNHGLVNIDSGTLNFVFGYTQTGGTTTVAAGAALISGANRQVRIDGGTLPGSGSVGSGAS